MSLFLIIVGSTGSVPKVQICLASRRERWVVPTYLAWLAWSEPSSRAGGHRNAAFRAGDGCQARAPIGGTDAANVLIITV